MSYALTATLDRPFGAAVDQVRTALAEQGFGVLTEIDLQATLRAKLGVEVPQHVILGACNPPLAHAALQSEPSIGLLLPCKRLAGDRMASAHRPANHHWQLSSGRRGLTDLDLWLW